MEQLPLLPGYSFRDISQTKFHVSHHFDFKNGYRRQITGQPGIGGNPRDIDSIAYHKDFEPVRYDPSLTYGRVTDVTLPQFVPHFVMFDKKSLSFRAFFKQSVFESPLEHYRVRHVNIIYFLEDDTITIMEPKVDNCGFDQGRLIKRGRIPKTTYGDFWHWKDFNVGQDVAFYGTVYHIVDCDVFTREYLESQGIEVNAPEDMPPDPYIMERYYKQQGPLQKTKTVDDKLRRFLEYDGKVLKFDAVWDDRNTDDSCNEIQRYIVFYFLSDDTIQVKEIHTENDGRDPFPVLLAKRKLPKNWKDLPINFPSIALEVTDEEVTEYYTPKDLLVGDTIFVLGRRFLLYDCDQFTRDYYKKVLNIIQKERINVFPPKKEFKRPLPPPHNVFGAPEDSIGNCLSVMPKPPKKDVVRYVINANKYLRYEAELDSAHPEDKIRKFVILYSLADCHISINEPPVKNSGIIGGRFLKSMLVPKPGTDQSYPEYYTPADFYIGAKINIFQHRFIITGADLFVYRYMEENPEKFSKETVDNVRSYMFCKGYLKPDIENRAKEIIEEEADHKIYYENDVENEFQQLDINRE